MREMPTPHSRGLALLAPLLVLATPLQAQRREYLLELGATGAVTSFANVTNLDAGFGGGVRLGFWLPLNLGVEVEGLSVSAKTPAGASANVLTGTASLLYNIRVGESSSLFLKGGLGSVRYSDSCPTTSGGNLDPACGTASAFALGGGFRAALSPVLMLRGGADYQRNSDSTSFSNLVGSLGLAVMVGSRPLLDADRDGVFDRKDKCPGTPAGAIVNRRGCPSDTDADGVPDGLDRCPNTPAGATVSSAGCPSDTDKDGVPDGVDQCSNTAAGAQVDALGCATDADADGVPDGLDRCPATPEGATVDALGCPGDADNDKVPDGVDQCPGTPAGVIVNTLGCPAPAGAAASGLGPWTVSGTAFAPMSSTIGVSALPVLDSVVALLRAYPGTTMEIIGHADEASTQAANMQLSADRADAVRNYLLRSGVRPDQLQASGAGAGGAEPADPAGATTQNRRTDIRIVGP
jgi:hypothetical protein